MAIDLNRERPITFAEAAATLPRRRNGSNARPTTLYRWSKAGLRGVRLETIQIGGTRCTSHEALQRFFERLTPCSDTDVAAEPLFLAVACSRTCAQRERRAREAARRLEALGA
jgi:hypothetical protein